MPTRTWTAVDSEGNAYTMTWADGQGNGQTLTPADAEWKFYLTTETETYHKLDKAYLPEDTVYKADLKAVEDKIPTEVGEDNIIEVIKANGVALPIVDKTVDIPLATAEAVGLVKTNNEVNGVKLNDNNQMEVVSLNVNKLVQTDYIIFNGGNAALDFPIENN